MEENGSLHVLLIEDDPATRDNLRDILELDDHRVEGVGSAAEALAWRDWSSISAIILDRRLPDATADDLLPRLRAAAPLAAVIVVTGYADLQGAISALRQGATDYILKPIEADELRARLRRLAEARRAESELKRQAELIRSLLDNVTDAVIVFDPEGKVLLHNPAAEALIGPLRDGGPPQGWHPPEGDARPGAPPPGDSGAEPLSRALRSQQIIDQEVYVGRPGGAGGRWLSVNASPIRHDGDVKGAVVIYHDVTRRKLAEEELRRERDLAEGLIESAPALVIVLSPEGRIRRFNRFAEELTGFRAQEIMDQDFFTHLLPDRERCKIQGVFRDTVEGVGTSGTLNVIVTKDGREREVRWSNRVLKDAESKVVGVLAIGQDVEDLREAQERALRAERLAAIGQMVAGLAHESRNALQRSQACLEMLALQVPDRPEALDLIGRLQRAQDHLHHLYEDVRGYAAPIRLDKGDCDLIEIWREAWENLGDHRRGRSVILRERIEDPDLWCHVDPFRLVQVLRNIFENSLAAAPDPVEVEIRCTRSEIGGEPALLLAIRDNGPGLGPEERLRLFEPFFTTKTKGTGLGMAIARRIIEAHGGRISAGEGAGHGAEVLILIPRGEP